MFGRKRDRRDGEPVDIDHQELDDLDAQETDEPEIDEANEALTDDDAEMARWDELEDSRDWRDDGPFDISEVDVEDDEVPRLGFGSVVLTPVPTMEMQLQVNPETQAIQAALVMYQGSGLEVALFAAPSSGGLGRQIRRQILANTAAEGGEASVAEGPFGPEVRRIVPVTTSDGQEATHVSRTWLVEGPRWLLRGVLMGEVCLQPDDAPLTHEFIEFFKNIIVARDSRPRPAGDVIPLTLPEDMAPAG